ncbi:RagB/SusD family nutrient uptake outer membrane protein [Bacteroides pyogenes]|uniref:RagB/SusD family nutrient uptake outer membrane protein n=1 Tax=Bacteroides pyogenes TaxID=310300 RepID=UPI0011E46F19|nr:RagB/SusD family nutrient uptake outer membrane protein [Bacteroides pyogenes]MBR8708792.1 hypothetical protein [Bacteroides pyogenes]MBR8717579.1 hypothetical protein [Bacteroides pyogenes]MBR8747091.1 hypothetical protein [Bacteroides pyogenes]MBR8757435.1 hypothetical protein [Bacteroides pyogenes]MBR8780661.1 hypothetical protein [Bacteroides pyogenes]
MKKIYLSILSVLLLAFSGCSNFLDEKPNGILGDDDISGIDQIEKNVFSAYAMLGNDHYDTPFSLWPYGNVRSDDAYKGGRDESDIQVFHFYETSSNIVPTFGEPDGFFYNCYIAISRINNAMRVLNTVSEREFEMKNRRLGECRFLRGHFYFLLKIMFKNMPYIDETVPTDAYGTVSNVELTNDESWAKIAADFKFAYDNLPDVQPEVGRANKYAAAAYLAKVYLYKAYRQDERHNVTGVDANDLDQVLTYTAAVIGSPYDLATDFAHNFLPGKTTYENGIEALFSIQFSKDDGTSKGRLNFSDALNVPLNTSGACDFQKPSQNLVNAFKTKNGLPDFNSYNVNDYDDSADDVDPRLYHTIAMVGYPYKYDSGNIFEAGHNRNPGVYGSYSSLKENVKVGDESSVLIDPFRANTKNRIIIRYADVLLMRAEALIELNRELEALPLINKVRTRAKNSIALIPYATNVNVALYANDATWTNEYARTALRWERRLEFAMEGSRFFDLVRWGIADSVLNTYYAGEKSKRTYYEGAHFDKNKEEYVPIPQQQINFSKNVYKQNYNY